MREREGSGHHNVNGAGKLRIVGELSNRAAGQRDDHGIGVVARGIHDTRRGVDSHIAWVRATSGADGGGNSSPFDSKDALGAACRTVTDGVNSAALLVVSHHACEAPRAGGEAGAGASAEGKHAPIRNQAAACSVHDTARKINFYFKTYKNKIIRIICLNYLMKTV